MRRVAQGRAGMALTFILGLRGSFGNELTVRLGAAVSPEQLGSFASIVPDLRQHITDQQGSAR